jgi:thiol:disulfide interchange protein DsbA
MKNILKSLIVLSFGVLSLQAATRDLIKGEDYEVMSPKGSKSAEVMEFFNYACGACYSMEGFVSQFKKNNPEIKVIPVPNNLGHPQWNIYVKAYHIGELLKVLDKSHSKLFHLVNVEKKQLVKDADLKAFFIGLGVDAVQYEKADKSFALSAKMRKSKQLVRKYQVISTPTFVVNRRFKLDNKKLSSTELIEKALKELSVVSL